LHSTLLFIEFIVGTTQIVPNRNIHFTVSVKG